MPRVLYIHHRPQPSGALRSLALLIEALSPAWEPHVLLPEGAGAELLRGGRATVHTGPVPAFTHTWDVQYGGLRWFVLGREAAWAVPHLKRLSALLAALRPDLVHLNDAVLLPSGVLAARRGRPVVWHLRSSLPHGGSDRRSRRVARVIERTGSAAIAIDTDVAETFALRIPTAIVPNAVEVDRHANPAELGASDERIAVGYFGYLRRQKGWPEFVEAMRLLVTRGSPVRAVVVGGGVRESAAYRGVRGLALRSLGVEDEERSMRELVHRLGLGDSFTFLPFVQDTAPIYEALDVVVFPNQGAGLGRPVLEAAAHGVPVVASGSASGAGLLLPEETGILLPRATPKALADAIERLATDSELRSRLGVAAAAQSARLHDPAVAAAAVERVYAEVLEGEANAR